MATQTAGSPIADKETSGDLEKGNDSDMDLEDKIEIETSRIPSLTTQDDALSPKEPSNPVAAPPQQQVNLADWNGPDDPENPMNWPMWIRVYHSTIPALFGFAVTFGTSIYTPAVSSIMLSFDISRTTALLGLTLYTLGLGLGPIITAPLSEGHGRKPVYLISSPVFMLLTLGAAFCKKSFAGFCTLRFLAGMAGSPALAVGAGTSADVFLPEQRAVVTSMFLMAPFAGPSLGPIAGGFLAQYKSWPWTQYTMLFVTLPIFLLALPTRETYKPIILQRRAARLNLPSPLPRPNKSLKHTLVLKFARPMYMLTTEPAVFFFSLYTAFAFAVLFLFFAAFPYIFARQPYGFTVSQVGLTFVVFGIGVLLGSATGVLVDRTVYQRKHAEAVARGQKNAAPEHRLYSAMIGSVGILVGLFWFGWCAAKGVHWAGTLVGAIPFAWGNICLFTSAVLYMVDVYGPMNGASAIAANGVARYTLGAVFPLFTVQMYEALGVGWATSLLGFLSLAMIPIPFLFFKYGPKIRARSQYL